MYATADQYILLYEGVRLMDALREYVISIVAAALICGILIAIVHESRSNLFIRLLCGLFLTISVIQPFTGWDIENIRLDASAYSDYGKEAAVAGAQLSQKAMADIITQNTEAYILDKALALNANLTVTVSLNSELIPERVHLSGKISPYAQEMMESIIESELGITKENQLWTG